MSNTKNSWQQLGAVSPVELQDTRLYLQYALQWVHRAALCTPPAEQQASTEEMEEMHAPLYWDAEAIGFFSKPYKDGKRVGLTLDEGVAMLTFGAAKAASGGEQQQQLFELDGHTDAEARLWVREQIEDSAYDTTEYNDPSELPAHPLAEGARYKLSELGGSITEIARWLSNAHLLLEDLRQAHERLLCTLEYFDLRLYHARTKSDSRRLLLGMSLGDSLHPQPYFYVLAQPEWQEVPTFANNLCGLHKKQPTTIILLSEKIVNLVHQHSLTHDFLQQAIKLPLGGTR